MAEIIENTEQTTEPNAKSQTPDNLLIYPVATSDTTEETSDTSKGKNTAEKAVSDAETVTETSPDSSTEEKASEASENLATESKSSEASENAVAESKSSESSKDPDAENKSSEPSKDPDVENKSSEPSKDPAAENKNSDSSRSSAAETTTNTTAEDIDDDDYYDQTSSNTAKNDHPFRDFFSNFHSKRKMELNRDEMILSRISDEDLMEYLHLEQKRLEVLQHAKDVREKRIWIAFQVAISLLSVVLIVYFLKDNPVILVTILYTIGILIALRISKRPSDSGSHKNSSDDTAKKPWE